MVRPSLPVIPRWELTFGEYWALEDSERHEKLLAFFREEGTFNINADTILTQETMKELDKWLYFRHPEKMGNGVVQRKKRFQCLRHSFLAEYLYIVSGMKKDIIFLKEKEESRSHRKAKFWLPVPCSNDETEIQRLHDLRSRVGKDHWSLQQSPVTKDSRRRAANRRRKKEQANVITPTKDNATKYQNKVTPVSNSGNNIAPNIVTPSSNSANIITPSSGNNCAQSDSQNNVTALVSPSSNLGLMQLDFEPNSKKKNELHKYGMDFCNDLDLPILQNDTVVKYARHVLVTLREKCSNDIQRMRQVLDIVIERVERVEEEFGVARADEVMVERSWQEKARKCMEVCDNIANFVQMPMFRSVKGRRDTRKQHALNAVWCAMSPHSSFSTIYGCVESAVIRDDGTNEIKLNWGGILYTKDINILHKETPLMVEDTRSSLTPYQLSKLMGSKNRNAPQAKRGWGQRHQLCQGFDVFKNLPFQKLRDDNVDAFIEKAVYDFHHDPLYVRPDNYNKQTYACRDSDGLHCHHTRHNYACPGNFVMQFEHFKSSNHIEKFANLLAMEFPSRFSERSLAMKKVTFRKFMLYRPNCVKCQTRASCVDPYCSKAHDACLPLQLYFRRKNTESRVSYIDNDEINSIYYDPDIDEFHDEEGEEENPVDSTFVEVCTCEACSQGKDSWIDIFRVKNNKSPLHALIDHFLCPRIVHEKLSLNGERPFKAHEFKCGDQSCENCGIDTLPWDCPQVSQNEDLIKVWIWDTDELGQEVTYAVKKKVKDVAVMLRDALKVYLPKYIRTVFINRQFYLALMKLPRNKIQFRTDFAAMMDFIPIRKVNCHVNTHGVMCIFCAFYKAPVQLKSGEVIDDFIHAENFVGLGRKGNDWCTSNAFKRHLIEHFARKEPEKNENDTATDGCRSQYLCVQNMYQLAGETKKHDNLNMVKHMIAMPHNFKGKHDTVGNMVNVDIRKEEISQNVFCRGPLMAYQMLCKRIERCPPPMQKALAEGSESLKQKSPFQTTRQQYVWIEDDLERYEKLKRNLPPHYHIIYADRDYMETYESEITPIQGITKCHVFCHKKEHDELTSDDFPPIEGEQNYYPCRYCSTVYKRRGDHDKHEKKCKAIIDSGKARLIEYAEMPCYCNECEGDMNKDCTYNEFKGKVKRTWLVPKEDLSHINTQVETEKQAGEELERVSLVRDTLNDVFGRFLCSNSFDPNQGVPDDESMAMIPQFGDPRLKNIKVNELKCFAQILNLKVNRRDGKKGSPLRSDYEQSLNDAGGWKSIIEKEIQKET